MKKQTMMLVLATACGIHTSLTHAQGSPSPLVRLAEIEVQEGQLTAYKFFLREEIEASMHTEPGVLTMYAVSLKDQPTHIRLFEQYSDEEAYRAHLRSPHFLKYKATTEQMVLSLRLLDAVPLVLAQKPNPH